MTTAEQEVGESEGISRGETPDCTKGGSVKTLLTKSMEILHLCIY